MKPEDFGPYLNKFISVRLDDGTTDAGYIANPMDFRDFPDDNMRVRLINGLLQTEIEMIFNPQPGSMKKISIRSSSSRPN